MYNGENFVDSRELFIYDLLTNGMLSVFSAVTVVEVSETKFAVAAF